MADPDHPWLIFTTSLPGGSASTPRVRLWRALRELGVASLRDGVGLLPAGEGRRERLLALGEQVESGGGQAWLFELPAQAEGLQTRLRAAFDRSAAWQGLQADLRTLRADLPGLDEAAARRRLRHLERELAQVAQTDFFPTSEQPATRRLCAELGAQVNRRYSPDEPQAASGAIPALARADFQGRLWATRRRLWVDRVASAWLIRRHIDAEARFLWLAEPAACPDQALGFDFDGATFTHVGARVTFEVLLAGFGLASAPGLGALGRLVHYLDVGGEPVAEAAGFEAVLAGLREVAPDDDALLAAVSPVLDALQRRYAAAAQA